MIILEFLGVAFVAIILFFPAFIAFFTPAQKNKGHKISKVGARVAFYMILLLFILINSIRLNTRFSDFIYSAGAVIFLCAFATVAFFVPRKNLIAKIIGITAFVLLLAGVVFISLFIMLAIFMQSGNILDIIW